jgi:hypothetical protein
VEFGKQFLKFLQTAGLLDGRPHVILLDSHYSHLYNIEFLEMMLHNNIRVFALPSHCSHWLQPLDRGVFSSFKKAWCEEMRMFTRSAAGGKLEKRDFFRIFNPSWKKAFTIENCQGAFRGSGIFPFHPSAVPEAAYLPSRITERSMSNISNVGLSSEPVVRKETDLIAPSTNTPADLPAPTTSDSDVLPAAVCTEQFIPSTSRPASGDYDDLPAPTTSDSDVLPAAVCTEQFIPSTSTSGDSVLTFAQLLPVPHRERPCIKRPRIKPPSYELTSAETLTHISNKMKPQISAKERASKRKPVHNADEFVKKKTCQKKKSKKKIQVAGMKEAKNSKSLDTDNTPCAFCQWIYGDISDPLIEDYWEMCVNCNKWYHHTCASVCGEFKAGSFCCDNNCI